MMTCKINADDMNTLRVALGHMRRHYADDHMESGDYARKRIDTALEHLDACE